MFDITDSRIVNNSSFLNCLKVQESGMSFPFKPISVTKIRNHRSKKTLKSNQFKIKGLHVVYPLLKV